MFPVSYCRWLALLTLLLAATSQAASSTGASLATEIQRLAKTEGFSISGFDVLKQVPIPANYSKNGGAAQVRQLLNDFDYVMVHGSDQRIQRLIIIGAKRAAPIPAPAASNPAPKGNETILPTRREGEHHLVNATLQGSGGKRLTQELLIDTGASLTVLPASLAPQLGFSLDSLATRELQTANGKLAARVGKLAMIELGTARVNDVEAAFVEDEKLRGHALLGMNLLRRYMFILDDEHNELTLVPEKR